VDDLEEPTFATARQLCVAGRVDESLATLRRMLEIEPQESRHELVVDLVYDGELLLEEEIASVWAHTLLLCVATLDPETQPDDDLSDHEIDRARALLEGAGVPCPPSAAGRERARRAGLPEDRRLLAEVGDALPRAEAEDGPARAALMLEVRDKLVAASRTSELSRFHQRLLESLASDEPAPSGRLRGR